MSGLNKHFDNDVYVNIATSTFSYVLEASAVLFKKDYLLKSSKNIKNIIKTKYLDKVLKLTPTYSYWTRSFANRSVLSPFNLNVLSQVMHL